ncbi:MAG: hypothetical protein WCQ47_05515 [bacterium]
MKKLLVIAVLALTASSSIFAQSFFNTNTKPNRFGEFMNGFIGRSKDIQDCRTVIQGDVSPLETAALVAATKGNTSATDISALLQAIQKK